MDTSLIKLIEVRKSYGSNEVLKGLEANFEKGFVYGIAGHNGAGKTTLFRCIAGLESCKGEVATSLKPVRNYLGYLSTNPMFINKMTGREYLQLFLHARGLEINDLDDRNIFGLPLDEYASNYSTGMKKKLALMSILIQQNQVYILDEPFNGVDIQSNMLIIEIIKQLKNLGKLVLISSHIFSTLETVCDEIYLLKGGRFVTQVDKTGFSELEQEMKDFSITDQVAKLNIR